MKARKKRVVWLICLIFFILLLTLFGLSRSRVEQVFSTAWYPKFSEVQRMLTGWLPFSIGDIIYLVAIFWLIYLILKLFFFIFTKRLTKKDFLSGLGKAGLVLLSVYVIFQSFWGLNYSRKGIAFQLGLKQPEYDTSNLLKMQQYLLQQVNEARTHVSYKKNSYPGNHEIFERAIQAYHEAADTFPFLRYNYPSIKSSLFGRVGNYLGFTGYYNPFTGEAQVNTSVPRFLLPAITTHEMAHQLGYAKENAASFVGYLVSTRCSDVFFNYSACLDLLLYVNYQVNTFDTLATKNTMQRLAPQVKEDIQEWKEFALAHRSFLETSTTWLYGYFLKWNEQPEGMKSYDQVVALVMSYYLKEGKL